MPSIESLLPGAPKAFATTVADRISHLAWQLASDHNQHVKAFVEDCFDQALDSSLASTASSITDVASALATEKARLRYRLRPLVADSFAPLPACKTDPAVPSERVAGFELQKSENGFPEAVSSNRTPAGFGMMDQATTIAQAFDRADMGNWKSDDPQEAAVCNGGESARLGQQSSVALLPSLRDTCCSDPSVFVPLPVWTRSLGTASQGRQAVTYLKPTQYSGFLDSIQDEDTIITPARYTRLLVLGPDSPIRTVIDLLGLILVVYDSFRVPLDLFEMPETVFSATMTWIIRVFWTIDFPLGFMRGFIRADGITEVRLRQIGVHYAYTWFFPDCVMVTSDWLEVLYASLDASSAGFARLAKTTRISRGLRALRLLRLVRLFRLVSFFKTSSFKLGSEKIVLVLDLVLILAVHIYVTHVMACFWYGLGAWTSRHGANTWLSQSSWPNYHDAPFSTRYMECFMWALTQYAGGTTTLTPQNFDERLFNSGSLLLGLTAAAAFVSGFTTSITRMLLLSNRPAKELAVLRRYLAQNRVSQRLVVRIQRNARHVVEARNKYITEEDVHLLLSISEPLRAELHHEIRGPILAKHPFFQKYRELCPSGMRQICQNSIYLKSLSPGDVIFSCGETPATPQMFFIADGSMRYDQPGKEPRAAAVGAWFSEAVLWTDWTHCGTLTAVTHVQLMALRADSFTHLASKFMTMHINPAKCALDFVEMLNELDAFDLSDMDMDTASSSPTSRGSQRNSRNSQTQRSSIRQSFLSKLSKSEG